MSEAECKETGNGYYNPGALSQFYFYEEFYLRIQQLEILVKTSDSDKLMAMNLLLQDFYSFL